MPYAIVVTLVAVVLGGLQGGPAPAETFWPQWRGPYATGVSRTADPPVEWSETTNIRWKVEIPGRGSGTPVVWAIGCSCSRQCPSWPTARRRTSASSIS